MELSSCFTNIHYSTTNIFVHVLGDKLKSEANVADIHNKGLQQVHFMETVD